jgi:hypothetical protein
VSSVSVYAHRYVDVTNMQKCQLSSWSLSLSVHMEQLHCAVEWILKSFSEMSWTTLSLLNVPCDVPVPFYF